MGVFGKAVFGHKTVEEQYDFAMHGLLHLRSHYGVDLAMNYAVQVGETTEAPKEPEEAPAQPTPKEIHELGTLNTPTLEINCHPDYVDEQVSILNHKLEALGPEPKKKRNRRNRNGTYDGLVDVMGENGAVRYGRMELKSMVERLNNRKKFAKTQKVFGEYAYTTTDAIRQVLADNKHLEAQRAERSIPDLPQEAVKAITEYTKATQDLCGKKPVFYLIKERQEEEAVQRKRDPILLAQSPFGFVWQILGAWDKEVVLLEEL
jgi:hypothetical protein